MRMVAIILLAGLNLLAGCSSYVYSGTFEALDSFGNDREFQVYWQRTDYAFVYGVANGPVSLRTECSLNTVLFEDSDDGVVFRRRENDQAMSVRPPGESDALCGRVIGVDEISDIEDGAGTLELASWCRPMSNRPARAYLQGRDDPYIVDITRVKSDEVPEPPTCR